MDELKKGVERRDLMVAVSAPDWKLPDLATINPEHVAQAIAEIEGALPLKRAEPEFNGPQAKALLDALRPIGAKLDPKMPRPDMEAWCSAVILALSDLPSRIALFGARKAIHRPMRFLREVDGVIRELAEEAMEQQATALYRLKRMRAEIERAANPPPALPPKPKMEWTQEKVDEANALFESQRIRTRYKLDPDDPEGVSSFLIDRDELAKSREEERARIVNSIDAAENEA